MKFMLDIIDVIILYYFISIYVSERPLVTKNILENKIVRENKDFSLNIS